MDLLKRFIICCFFIGLTSSNLFAQENKASFDIAHKLWEQGNYRAAIPLFTAYVAQYPKDDWGYHFLILSCLNISGSHPLLDSIFIRPKGLAGSYAKAFLLFHAGQYNASKTLAEQLYAKRYRTFLVLNLLGYLERIQGNPRYSIKYINEALAIDDEHSMVESNWDATIDFLHFMTYDYLKVCLPMSSKKH